MVSNLAHVMQSWKGNSAVGVRKAAEAAATALLSTHPPNGPLGAADIVIEHTNNPAHVLGCA